MNIPFLFQAENRSLNEDSAIARRGKATYYLLERGLELNIKLNQIRLKRKRNVHVLQRLLFV